MYKDMLYKKYKRRCIIGLILIILAHTIAISSILVDHFIKHERFSSDYISFFIWSTIIYILAASIDYEKFIAIKHNKYSAITVTCIRKELSLRRHKSGFICYYSFKNNIRQARLTFRSYIKIKADDRVLLVGFGSRSKIIPIHDEILPL